MVAQLPGVVPDGFVYLHASPETCARRMASRGRTEEGGVSLDYLANLHGKQRGVAAHRRAHLQRRGRLAKKAGAPS